MASEAKAERIQSHDVMNFLWVSHVDARAQEFVPVSAAFPGYKHGAETETDQPRLKVVPIKDAGLQAEALPTAWCQSHPCLFSIAKDNQEMAATFMMVHVCKS